ncbi:YdgA family protein [Ideonella sp.]|jgi:uncharacterized protein YdgA (DUF945 family)|uniref:YdgA family protein n=1 Tax=Ideonella sp. TaxID=1929293 RepID=UPI0037BE312C
MSKVGLWVAGGAVAVVAAGAAGTVMSGNKIEAKMTTETRQVLDKLSPLVTVQELKYDKTFTGATRTLTLKLGCGDTSFPLTWRDRIQHGPLPGFNSVGGAVIDSEFVLADDVKAKLKEAIGLDAAPLTMHSVVSLGGDITSDLAMPSVKAKLPDGTQLTWQGLTARSVQKGATTHYDMAMPSLEMVDADSGAVVKMVGFKSTGEASTGKYWWASPGTATGEIASIEVAGKPEDGEAVKLLMKGAKFSSKVSVDGDLLSTAAEGSTSLEINGHKVDKVLWQESAKRIHLPTIEEIALSFLNKENMGLICQGEAGKAALEQKMQQAGAELPMKLMALLPHNPEYSVDKVAATYQGKEGEVGYSLGTQGVTAEEVKPGAMNPMVLLKKVVASAQVKVPTAWLRAIADASKGDGEAPTDEAINAMIEPAIAQGFVVREGDFLVAKASFKNGAATLNGKPMPIPGLPPVAPQ